MDFIQEIEQHFKEEYPREGCGVIGIVKGKQRWFPCTNIAEENEDFILDSAEYLKLKRTVDITGIVHSHPDAGSEPSEMDIKYCNALGIPYYIWSYPGMELTIVQPTTNVTKLYGRSYEFGVLDCFTDELISEWGMIPVDLSDLQENDALVFNVQAQVGNHCGVYVGNECFYHHAEHRLSCRESLYPFWHKYLKGAYRYVA
jgi:proteasome lid subunit RPN8/RPN11